MESSYNEIMLIYLLTVIFAFPLFFFPFLPEAVFGAKQFFLILTVLGLFVWGAVRLLTKNKLVYKSDFLDVWPILFLLINIVSWFFLPSGAKVSSLAYPLGLGTILVLVLWYLAWGQTKLKEHKSKVFQALFLSALLISIVSVVLFILPDALSDNPLVIRLHQLGLASSLLRLQMLLVTGVLLAVEIVRDLNEKETLTRWWLGAAAVFVLVGLVVNSYQLVQEKPMFLDWFSSWATAVETFKRHPLRGVGPGNYGVAFTLFRPREFNQGEFWSLRFGSAHSWFLHVWTELGLLGLAALILLAYFSIKAARQQDDKRLFWFLLTIWLLLILFPGNLLLLFLLFLAIALVRNKVKTHQLALSIGRENRNIASVLASILLSGLVIIAGYFLYLVVKAEHSFYKAVRAASENRGGDSYQLQSKAIMTNRFISNYRVSFAQTNLAIANNIIQQSQEEGRELTEEEREQISQLIDQAVNEAKAAVALEPQRASNWENLAQIYNQLVNLVEGAEEWTLSTYQQAVSLDSLNPRLRVSYGGFLFALGRFEEAARQFEIAVNLKPDYANAWYNWAHASKQQGKLEVAIARLEQAANLIDRDLPDYERVQEELAQWREELGEQEIEEPAAEESGELTRPEPLPEGPIDQPIELPEEAAPPLDEEAEEEEGVEEEIEEAAEPETLE